MSRNHTDSFSALTNNKRMTRSEIRGFQLDFNVNLSDSESQDDWFDEEFCEPELTEISDEEFIHSYVLNDDLNDF